MQRRVVSRWRIFLLTFLFSQGLISCQDQDFLLPDELDSSLTEEEDNDVEATAYEGVDEALWDYFHRFEEAGKARGLDINIRTLGITGHLEAIDEGNVVGTCSYGGRRPNHVTIDTEFWAGSTDLLKEFVVFHELGHCYLSRGHNDESLNNGSCVSIMASGVGDCRDNYRSSTRTYYLDELFDNGTLP